LDAKRTKQESAEKLRQFSPLFEIARLLVRFDQVAASSRPVISLLSLRRGEKKRQNPPREAANNAAILATLWASFALAEDFKTVTGEEYKNAKVSRVESDGIVLITNSGISKVYFTEPPKEIQEHFHYDAGQAA
jgi:hypothetical protein